MEKTIRAAGSYCMDQSYFRFLFRLAGKSKQSGLSKSEKRFGLKECNLYCKIPSLALGVKALTV